VKTELKSRLSYLTPSLSCILQLTVSLIQNSLILNKVLSTLIHTTVWVVCNNVSPTLIAEQRNFKAKYLQNGEEN